MSTKGLFGMSSVLVAVVLGFSGMARAELDPELAQSSNKNDSGMYLGFGLKLGQAQATGGSNPGMAYLLSVEPGYVASRDSWARFEVGAEIGTGAASFKLKDDGKTDVDLGIPVYLLAKFGYGWSLGGSTFAIARLGAGPAFGTFKGETDDGTSLKSDGNETGFAGMVGFDVLMAAGQNFDFLAGASLTHVAFNFSDVADDKDETVNVNIPALYLGGRVTF